MFQKSETDGILRCKKKKDSKGSQYFPKIVSKHCVQNET